MPVHLLCAVEPAGLGRSLRERLREVELTLVEPTASAVEASLQRHVPGLIVIGPALFPRAEIEGWIGRVRALPGNPDVVLVHDSEEPEFRAAMLRAGSLAVLNAGLPIDDLARTLQALIGRRSEIVRLAARARSPQGRCSLDDFISRSEPMREFMTMAQRVVDADSSLLLLGETGTGKERLARAIHEEGPRAQGPFVAVNCGALPETLLESELFGHERGAFTGASRERRGYFEQAHGGTIFLDEIGEVPVHLQVRLLRVVEQRRVQRVGGEKSFPVDVRVMAATNRDLEREVAEGRFRRDLYYRLAVVTLALPPLRERREDVAGLVENYVQHFRGVLNRPVRAVDDEAMEALVGYAWPGNVRELINVVERAVLLAPGPSLRLQDLPRAISRRNETGTAGAAVAGGPAGADPADAWVDKPLAQARREVAEAFERAYLVRLLTDQRGRVGAAARRAGLNERSLYELMQKHGLRKEAFRSPR